MATRGRSGITGFVIGAPRLKIPDQFAALFMADVQKTNPEYFNDLPPLPAGR